jgi:hypothetical protein
MRRIYEGIAAAAVVGVTLSGCSANRQELALDDESRGLLQQITTICVGAALKETNVAIQVVPTMVEGQHRISVRGDDGEYDFVVPKKVGATATEVASVVESGDAKLVDWAHVTQGSSATVLRSQEQGQAVSLDVDPIHQGLDGRTIIIGMCPPYSSK